MADIEKVESTTGVETKKAATVEVKCLSENWTHAGKKIAVGEKVMVSERQATALREGKIAE